MPKYSQNFLIDGETAGKIVEAIASGDFDYLVEIGPGKGFLTKRLVAKFGRNFTAIEIDKGMINHLKKTIPPQNLPKIINADFLKLDLRKILPCKKICFAGNLPYAVAGAILQKVLNFEYFDSAVFMFQKEVANRITAKTKDKGYGVLTLSVEIKAKARQVCKVKKNCFRPVPKVDSAVVAFKKLYLPVFKSREAEDIFLNTVKSAFAHRRKTILNSLSKSLKLTKDDVGKLLKESEISPGLRPQNLNLKQYIKLSETMKGVKKLNG
jgi:16S rRNA (adenine1518-N6/adenine1519-N6)-dimethyltransferase